MHPKKLAEELRVEVVKFESRNSEEIEVLDTLQRNANADFEFLRNACSESHLDYVAARKVLIAKLSSFDARMKSLTPAHWEELNGGMKRINESVSGLLNGKFSYPKVPRVSVEEEKKVNHVEYKFANGLNEAVMLTTHDVNKGTLLETGIHRWKVRMDNVVTSSGSDVGVVSPQHHSHFNLGKSTAWGLRHDGHAYHSRVQTGKPFSSGAVLEFVLNCESKSLSCSVQGSLAHTFTDVLLPVHIAFTGHTGSKATIIPT
eukprot:TRINITY_DN7411_c0_g2_i1.p1 TRINITY_DN7411_c0_g2~~TRINITY_DN7411_c0_g2_i1.p1  ORF type:complete len:259 (+),score=64.79 TRINITY_DN7411_c0_g2_i1:285-1061(+)